MEFEEVVVGFEWVFMGGLEVFDELGEEGSVFVGEFVDVFGFDELWVWVVCV